MAKPTPEVEQACRCSECGSTTEKAFPDATGKWDCEECGHRHYPSHDDFGFRVDEDEPGEPAPTKVTAVVGICGNVAFTKVVPENACRDCLTECLADNITESGTFSVKCEGFLSGCPLDSDYGYECSLKLEKVT